MEYQEQASEVALQLLTVAEALRPSMPRVADLMDFAAEAIGHLFRAAYKERRETTADASKLADALRVCGCGDKPCYSCPYYAELDPFDCQTQIMLKAAEIIEQLAEEESCRI